MKSSIQSSLRNLIDWTGSLTASAIAVSSVVIWFACGFAWFGFGTEYQLWLSSATTIVTFVMVFLIQNSQNQDTKAIQAKLDELVAATSGARNELVAIEQRETEDGIEEKRLTKEECDAEEIR